jgi:hypothetical protein
MAHRRAVVATTAGGLPDKVEAGETAGWWPGRRLGAGCRGQRAISPGVDLAALGRHGRAIVERDFSGTRPPPRRRGCIASCSRARKN